MHETKFFNNETSQSIRERQYVQFDTTGHYDIQQLYTRVNLTEVDGKDPPVFVVAWGNRSTHITLEQLQENVGM